MMKKKYWMLIDMIVILTVVIILFSKVVQMMPEKQVESAEEIRTEKDTQEEHIAESGNSVSLNEKENLTTFQTDMVMESSKKEVPLEDKVYECYIADLTWEEAYQKCVDRGGHLVTFDSEEEFFFVVDQIIDKGYDNIKFYIGAKRESGIEEYRWFNSTGEYYGKVINNSSHWLSGEPSFYDAELEANKGIRVDECCVNMFYYQDEARWVWNDIPNDLLSAASYYSGKIGFICEYDD